MNDYDYICAECEHRFDSEAGGFENPYPPDECPFCGAPKDDIYEVDEYERNTQRNIDEDIAEDERLFRVEEKT